MRVVRSAVRRWTAGFLSGAIVVPVLAVTGVAVTGVAVTASPAAAAGFTAGNVVVLRVGDGAAALSTSAAAAFLDEYDLAGNRVQSIALPTDAAGGVATTLQGSATSEGFLNLSTDGRYLTYGGYDQAVGGSQPSGTTASAVNRVIGRVDGSGVLTTTALSDAYSGTTSTGVNIRSAITDDGSRYWTSGSSGGVRYATDGATTSTVVSSTISNNRVVGIADGQLYVDASTSVNTVGTGLPTTTGQTTTALGLTPAPAGAYGFTFLDRSSAVAGVDTLYVASDSGSGIYKYSFDGTTWTARGTFATLYRGLTGSVTGGTATLFGTTTTSSPSSLVRLVDSAAYDATISLTPTVLGSAATNTAFRGVAFAPTGGSTTPTAPVITDEPDGQAIQSGTTATLSVTATGTAPLSYQWYVGTSGDTTNPIAGATASSYTTPALTTTTSYWVRVTNAQGSDDSATATVTIAAPACLGAVTAIGAVQGSGETSPLSGQTVTVRGTVVSDDEGVSPALRGFYLQDAGDADAATSDGIFVFNGDADSVSNGQLVEVTGPAGEFQGQTQISGLSTVITVCGSGDTVTPTEVTLPVATATDLEKYEGMLVTFPQELSVTELFLLGRFGQVTLSVGGRLYQPTNVIDAQNQPAVQALQDLNNRSKIILDDSTQAQNPDPIAFGRGGQPLSAANTLRGGDTLTDAVGVLTYTWGGNGASPNAYRLRPLNALDGDATFVAANPRPTTAPDVGTGDLRVASFNLLNFFNTFTGCTFGVGGGAADCRGADNTTEYDRQLAKEVEAVQLLDADVIGYMEMENDGYGSSSAVQALVDALNADEGAGTWAFVNPDAETGVVNSAGDDAIKAGLLYRPAAVSPVDGATFTNLDPIFDRAPVAQTFATADGSRVTVIANHFKSKGSCPSSGPDADQGDGQACFNNRRTLQAAELVSWIDGTVIPGAGDEDVMILGDLNSYAGEDPIGVIEDAGYTNLVKQFQGEDAYSYVFDGQWGYLDYQLASPSLLAQVSGADDLHINSDEPTILDYNTEFKTVGQQASLYAPDPYRTSDHDPVLTGLALVAPGVAPTISGTPPAGTVGEAYSFAFTTSGDPTVTVTGGTLPPGLTLSSDGVLSGTPTDGGSYPVTIRATNAFGSTDLSVTIEISRATSVTTLAADPNPALPGADVTLTATVTGPVPATGSVLFSSDGSTLGSATIGSDGTAVLVISTSATGTFVVTAAYGGSSALLPSLSGSVSVEIVAPVELGATLPDGSVGVAYSQPVPVSGGDPITFSVTDGSLPPGLALSSDGVLSGTPTAGGSYSFVITATNAVSSDTQAYSVGIASATSTLTLSSTANPSQLGAPVQFTATVGTSVGSPAPGGTVQFAVDGQALGSPVPVGADGTAVSPAAAPTAGVRTVTAGYSGDVAFTGSTATPLRQLVEYVVQIVSPTPGQQIPAGSTVNTSFRLTDVNGTPILDNQARKLIGGSSCQVKVSAAGAQSFLPTCATYSSQANLFTVSKKTRGNTTGPVTLTITVTYPKSQVQQTATVAVTLI